MTIHEIRQFEHTDPVTGQKHLVTDEIVSYDEHEMRGPFGPFGVLKDWRADATLVPDDHKSLAPRDPT
jgi:hypothetical protein